MDAKPNPPWRSQGVPRTRSPLPCHLSYLIKFATIPDRLMNLEIHVSEEGSPPPPGDWTDTGAPIPGHTLRFRVEV